MPPVQPRPGHHRLLHQLHGHPQVPGGPPLRLAPPPPPRGVQGMILLSKTCLGFDIHRYSIWTSKMFLVIALALALAFRNKETIKCEIFDKLHLPGNLHQTGLEGPPSSSLHLSTPACGALWGSSVLMGGSWFHIFLFFFWKKVTKWMGRAGPQNFRKTLQIHMF